MSESSIDLTEALLSSMLFFRSDLICTSSSARKLGSYESSIHFRIAFAASRGLIMNALPKTLSYISCSFWSDKLMFRKRRKDSRTISLICSTVSPGAFYCMPLCLLKIWLWRLCRLWLTCIALPWPWWFYKNCGWGLWNSIAWEFKSLLLSTLTVDSRD